MLMKQNVNNDVTKDSPISKAKTVYMPNGQLLSVTILKIMGVRGGGGSN